MPMNMFTPAQIRRVLMVLISPLLAFVAPGFLQAQIKTPAAKEEEIVVLSKFQVDETRGKGYFSQSAVTGLKSRALLIDIPQSVMVVPRDIIEDVGQLLTVAETLQFVSAGTTSYSRIGDFQMQRGYRTGYVLLDGQIDLAQYSDSVMIDSYEVIKGPTAVLFGARTGLAGAILKHSRKPLPVNRRTVRVIGGEGGLIRGELDVTGPAGSIGEADLSYRFYSAVQEYDGFEPVDHDNRRAVGGGFKIEFNRNTSLLLQGDFFSNHALPNMIHFDDQAGTGTYTGPGSEKGYMPRWMDSAIDRGWGRATFSHRFNDSWEVVAGLVYNNLDRDDQAVYGRSVVWASNVLNQTYTGWLFNQKLGAGQIDVNGDFKLFGMKHRSTFGFASERERRHARHWAIPTLSTSITNPNTYDLPKFDFIAFRPDGAAGTGTNNTRSVRLENFAYYMHTVELIPDSLSVVAGYQGTHLSTVNTNIVTQVVSEVTTKGQPYRVGVVYKPRSVKGLALYVNNSTMFQGGGTTTTDGRVLPPLIGTVKEIGFKTDLYEGRVSSTITYFDLSLTNVTVPRVDPVTGIFAQFPVGTQTNKGFEVDLAVRPTKDWTIMAGLYRGDILGENGLRQAHTINESYNLLTRYDFSSGSIKGLFLGASLFHQGDRTGAAWPAYEVYNAMFGYSHKSWAVAVNIENLADKVYSQGGWSTVLKQLGRPRNAKVTFGYSF